MKKIFSLLKNLESICAKQIQQRIFLGLILFSLVGSTVRAGQKVYINFSDQATTAASPWNNMQGLTAGYTMSNLIDDTGASTSVGIQMVNAWTGSNNSGVTSGIYPTEVTSTFYYISDNSNYTIKITGLSTSNQYSFTFFASRASTGDRTTQYTINGTSVSLDAANNSSNTVVISNITPNASGEVTITCNKTTAALYGYINALVIEKATTTTTYSLTINTPSNGTISVSAIAPYTPGQVITVTANPSQGYQFTGWNTTDLTGTTNPTTLTMNSSKTIGATFSLIGNQAPVASNVVILGNTYTGMQLTGNYTYSDAESNPQGATTFKWYRADSNTGTNVAQISGETNIYYILKAADVGKYIKFEVTPVATAGTSPGTAVQSSYIGPMTADATGDNLGNHLMQQNLVMNNFSLVNSSSSTATQGIRIDNSGKVGIGTINPTGRLSITDGTLHINTPGNGSASIDDLSTAIVLGPKASRTSTIGTYYAGLAFNHLLNYQNTTTFNSNNHAWIGLRLTSTSTSELSDLIFATKSTTDNSARPIERMCIKSNGNVLIGTTTQSQNGISNYKLEVNGTIRAKEIVVNTDGADFVFEPSYKLISLDELELFVKTNKHLPQIVSAKDMQENGLNMSEMQTKLLQKIEELTLYMIEKDKQINLQNTKISEQQKLLTKLKEQVDSLTR